MPYLTLADSTLKECRTCEESKPETIEFFRFRKDSGKYRTDCISCSEAHKKAYREANPDKVRATSRKTQAKRKANGKQKDSLLRNSFNIGLEEYNIMFEEQKGCCKLCNKHQTECKRALAVDHCHEHENNTGNILVRGLLCNNCNLGLGNFKDNKEVLELAIKYLNTKGEL